MLLSNYQPNVTQDLMKEMKNALNPPFDEDVWLLSDEVFLKYGEIGKLGATKNSTIRFKFLPDLISLEVKYFLFKQLTGYNLSLRTVYSYGQCLTRFGVFCNLKGYKIAMKRLELCQPLFYYD